MAGNTNKNLSKANIAKNDEFYTQITDIEKEMKYYEDKFKGKHIFCNCDDPEFSNFWRYFALNFDRLGLKRLTSTHYDEGVSTYQMDMYKEVPSDAKNKKTFLTLEGMGINLNLGYITPLEGDGDFRSDESIGILKECDIVVTNPPFSLFREYVAQLMEYKKDFLIIGNQNAVTYKEIFPLIAEKRIWWGISMNGSNRYFRVPDSYHLTEKTGKIENGEKFAFVKGVRWFTNLEHKKRHENLILYKKYTSDDYPTYDNYNAIDVSQVSNIPEDYYGVMGVPITFLDKYNPEQFDILGISKTWATNFEVKSNKKYTNALQYSQHGNVQSGNKVNDGAVIACEEKPTKGAYYTADESELYLQQKYARIFVKRKEQLNEN